jgi:hypothetical protein
VVAEAREGVTRACLKSRSRILSLWLKATGLDDDALCVAERINGILRSDDALQLVADFSRAEPCVAAAVAASLTGHQVAVGAAADRARRIVERTDRLGSRGHRDWTSLARSYRKGPCGISIVLGTE